MDDDRFEIVDTREGAPPAPQQAAPQDAPAPAAPSAPAAEDRFEIVDSREQPKAQPSTPRPHPADDANAPELGWGEALGRGASNFLPDAGHVIKDTARALTLDLPQTAHAVGEIGKGAFSKLQGAVGVQQDPDQKAASERMIDALGQHYKQRYGSVKGFKSAIAEHPAEVTMDASTPFSLGTGALAKNLGTASRIGKIAQGASNIAMKYGDPVSAAVTTAGHVLKPVNSMAKSLAAGAASVPKPILDIAEEAGRTTDPVLRDTFRDHFSGKADARELLDASQQAIETARQAHSAHFAATKAGQAASAKVPNYMPIQQSVDDAIKALNGGASAPSALSFKDRNAMLQEIKQLVDDYAAHPQMNNYLGLDQLKRDIGDASARHGMKGHTAGGHDVGVVQQAVRKELDNIAPGYGDLMDHWQNSLNEIRDLQSGLALGKNADAAKTLTRMLQRQKTEHGQDLIDNLASYDPRLPYMLAGQTLRPWMHKDLLGNLKWMASVGAAGAMMHPGPLVGAAASSPKIMGAAQYGYGAARRLAATPSGAAVKYGAYEADKALHAPEDTDTADSNAPLGSRINNPSSIKDSPWARKQPGYKGTHTTPNGQTFAVYDTPEAGEDAAKSLMRYHFNNGVDTIDKMVNKLTPVGNENTPEQVENKKRVIENALKISRNQRLDFSRQDLLDRYAAADGLAETGFQVPRAARASGGRVIDHQAEADRLISAAGRGLNEHNESTKPLLEMHDDAVASALKTADKYI